MNPRMSNAYVASALLHGGIVAAVILWAYVFGNREVDTKIIELVRGEGDNYGATVAPAAGTPEGTKAQTPDADSGPVAPPEPKAMEAVAAPTPSDAKPVTKTPNFTQQIARVSERVQQREMKKYEKELKAKAEAEEKARLAREKEEAAAAAAVNQNRMTKEEFDRRFPNRSGSNAAPGSIKTTKIDVKGIVGGVAGGSTENTKGGAGGTAMSREEGNMLDAYFSLLIQRLKEAHERPTGVSDLLSAQAEFMISHDGTLSGVRISRSSGSPEFDQSVLSAFRNVGSIGPRPDSGGTLTKKVTFKMRDD